MICAAGGRKPAVLDVPAQDMVMSAHTVKTNGQPRWLVQNAKGKDTVNAPCVGVRGR